MKKALRRYVVADPAVCHGRPTFRGTRIFVSDVLDDVARGMAWEAIIVRLEAMVRVNSINRSKELAELFLCQPSEVILP